MKIKEIKSQHRNDFIELVECEHCGHKELNRREYDDTNYHQNVLPTMECANCGKTSKDEVK